MKTGVCEFAFWNEDESGVCFYRHSGKYFKDVLNNKNYRLERTIEISKAEYMNNLSEYWKLLKKERF